MHIFISAKVAKSIFVAMLLLSVCLVLGSTTARYYGSFPEPLSSIFSMFEGDVPGTIDLLDVDSEVSIPAWFSSSALLFCSVLLVSIASSKSAERDHYATHWKVLALIFLLLSLDEAVSLHEKTVSPLRSVLNVDGFLYFAWVIPGAVFVLLFALAYLRFFLDLPTKTKWLFAVAGALYIGGALGIEIIEGREFDLNDYSTAFGVMTTIEEALELFGIIIFTYALMRYTAPRFRELDEPATEHDFGRRASVDSCS